MSLELDFRVGQVGNLPPIENRRRTRPQKFLRRSHQPSLYWIHFNISGNPPKLRVVPNQPVIALVLPKRTSGKAEKPVALPPGISFERLHDRGNVAEWRNQKMHMIRHHGKRMQLEVSLIPIPNCFHDNTGNFGLLEKQRSSTSIIKKPIDSQEGLSGSGFQGKASMSGQTPIQWPSEKYRLTDGIKVRQPPLMERSHKEKVDLSEKLLNVVVGQVGNLPPLEKRPCTELANFQSAAGYQPALQ